MNGLELAEVVYKTTSPMFDEVAALVIDREKTMVKLWNTEPSIVQSWLETSISLRLSKMNKLWVLDFDTRDVLHVVRNLEELMKEIDRVEKSELYSPLPEPGRCNPIREAYDINVVKYMENPGSLVDELIRGALEYRVDRLAGTITLHKTRKSLITSRGFECSEEVTGVEVYTRVFRDEYSGHWAYGSTRLSLEKIRETGRKASEIASLVDEKIEIQPGKYDVVLSPLVVGNLFNYIGYMASAFSVITGFSMFAKYKPGERIGSEIISMYDKPRDYLLPHTRGFDDEGVETYDKPIIENGVVSTLLHNSGTALKTSSRHTGNAGWIWPIAWNIEISRGDIREEDLHSTLGEGVVVTNNWYTRLQNYYEGVFSTVSRDNALYVKNGEVVGHVGRVRIATSFPNLLSNVINSSRETYDIWWWEVRIPTRAPWLLVKNIPLTKPEV